jgi:integrase
MRPKVTKRATKTPGVRKVTRTYGDGREVVKYEVRIADATGAAVNAGTYDGYTEAKKAREEKTSEMRDGNFVPGKAGRVRFIDVANEWMKTPEFLERKVKTCQTDRVMLNARMAPLHDKWIDKFTEKTARDWLDGLATGADGKRPLAASSRRRYLWLLNAILNHAQGRYIAKNPAQGIKKPATVKRDVTMPETDEVRDLLAAFVNRGNVRDELFVLTAVHTGMRAGELCGLRVRALDFRRNEIAVRETVVDEGGILRADTPKSMKTRVLHDVSADLMARLRLFTVDMRSGDYVFGHGDAPLRYGNWDGRVFDVVRREVALPNLRFHDLRHYHASLLIEAGLSPVQVAERLGHHSPTVTMDVYAHEFKRRDVDNRASAAVDAALSSPTADNVVRLTKATG